MLQRQKYSNHLPVKGHLLYDAVWISRHSVVSEKLSAFVFSVALRRPFRWKQQFTPRRKHGISYQDQPVVVVEGIIAVVENCSKHVKQTAGGRDSSCHCVFKSSGE